MTQPRNTDAPARITSFAALEQRAAKAAKKPMEIDAGEAGAITFPDPGGMEGPDAEKMLRTILDPNTSILESLQEWLSEEDYQKLTDAKLSFRALRFLSGEVTKYYGDIFGMPGESNASRS